MTVKTPEMVTMLILLLVMILPIILVKMHTRKKAKLRQDFFSQHCEEENMAIRFLMLRKNRIAALDTDKNKIALADFTQSEQPSIQFYEFKEVVKKIKTDGDAPFIRKVSLIIEEQKNAALKVEVAFYDTEQDNHSKVESYLEEARTWEKAIV